MKIRLLILFLSPLFIRAQYLPDLAIPKLKPDYYESLQAKTSLQTRSDFQLKGPVKSVCETIRALKSNGRDSSAWLKAEYLFSEKGNLLSYSEDSTSNLLKGYDPVNHLMNSYDSTGEILLETIRWTGDWRESKTVVRFNERGFREHEEYTCYSCSRDYRNQPINDSIFNYTLDYQWSRNFDSVSLKYRYVKPKSPYQRNQDMVRSFVHELDRKKRDSLEDNIPTIWDPRNGYFQDVENDIKRDKHNRITEWTVWDNTIKNSINVHRRTEYTYNEKDELTEIKHYSTFRSKSYNEFQLELKEEIVYVSYDVYGNWTEKEVKVRPEKHGMYHAPKDQNFRYKREISYY